MKRCLFFVTCLALINVAFSVPCRELDIGDCITQPACTICKFDTTWAKVTFCVSEETAEKLPSEMFTCGEEPVPPTSVELDMGTRNDECGDLSKGSCEGNPTCAWCVSAAVPSACYTVEQAKRLPAAVFTCELPTLQA